MRILAVACGLLVALAATGDNVFFVEAKKPSRSAGVPPRRGSSSRSSGRGRAAPVSRRRAYEEEEDEEEDEEEFGFPENDLEDDYDDELEEEEEVLRPIPSKKRRGGEVPRKSRKASSRPPRKKQSRRPQFMDDEYDYDDDDYDRAPPPRSNRGRGSSRRGPPPRYNGGRGGRGGRSGGRVVRYREPEPNTFTRGLTALRESIPDPAAVRNKAAATISAARETSSKLSTTLYREVKGLTSSELEQVMLKATRPDDTPVKGKHVERLVGVTYQISAQHDIYEAILRKLWKKMTERDWRTTIKALYVLHRFSSDGAPEHAPALKVI